MIPVMIGAIAMVLTGLLMIANHYLTSPSDYSSLSLIMRAAVIAFLLLGSLVSLWFPIAGWIVAPILMIIAVLLLVLG